MFTIVTLLSAVALASAKPGHLLSSPIHVAEEIYPVDTPVYPAVHAVAPIPIVKQVIAEPAPVHEPQDVTYTRTDVISRKITASAPQHLFYQVGAHTPHTIKNTHYTEENIVHGQNRPTEIENGPAVEANFRRIQVDIPQPPQVEVNVRSRPSEGQQPPERLQAPQPRPPNTDAVEVPGPILRSSAPPQAPIRQFPEDLNRQLELRRNGPPPFAPLPLPQEQQLYPLPGPVPRIQGAPIPTRPDPAFLQEANVRAEQAAVAYAAPTPVKAAVTYAAPAPVQTAITYAAPAPVQAAVTYTASAPSAVAYASPAPAAVSYIAPAPITKVEAAAPLTIGYPFSASQVNDVRKTFYTPLQTPLTYAAQITPAVSKVEIYDTPSLGRRDCDDNVEVEQKTALKSPIVRTEIYHGPGAVSSYY